MSGWCDINWGSVPEWLGGIGTAGALILGLIVLKRDAAARSEETRRRQATDDERRRMQASKVTGLITDDRIQVAELPLAQSPISVLTARAHNDSDQPIYRVVGLVKDAVTSASVRTVTFVDVLPGGHQSFVDISDLLAAGHSETNNHWLLVVGFTDTNGLSWNRLADGRLRQSSRPGEIADE